jgi:hypothetical protein
MNPYETDGVGQTQAFAGTGRKGLLHVERVSEELLT